MLLAIVIMNNVALISALLKRAARINEIRSPAHDSIQYKQLGDERLGQCHSPHPQSSYSFFTAAPATQINQAEQPSSPRLCQRASRRRCSRRFSAARPARLVISPSSHSCGRELHLPIRESSVISHAGTVLLAEIMSIIAQSNCGIRNRRNAFATGDETLAFSRKMMKMSHLKEETARSCSFIPPEVRAKPPMENLTVIMQSHQPPVVPDH
ncbi:hypothetical protein IRJ41_004727 [Triplophysa rosa]|uniref:Uncharacterized protein n=1 Tax=Triplophysa rosa TaxID=992332 RepID=A0A9W7WFF7_TRIRA|nr:hypothetical protein IRJ41_004727 [Triplophysa rosa]